MLYEVITLCRCVGRLGVARQVSADAGGWDRHHGRAVSCVDRAFRLLIGEDVSEGDTRGIVDTYMIV